MKKRKKPMLLVFGVALLVLNGCDMLNSAQDELTTVTRNLPSRITLTTPKSLHSSSPGEMGFSARNIVAPAVHSSGESGPGDIEILQLSVSLMDLMRQYVALEFIIADRMIGSAFTPGTEKTDANYTFVVTQNVVDAVSELMRADSDVTTGGGEQMPLPRVGDQLTISFEYEPQGVAASGGFAHQLTFMNISPIMNGSFNGHPDGVPYPETTLFWSEDNRSVAIVTDITGLLDASAEGDNGRSNEFVAYIYDDNTRTASFTFALSGESGESSGSSGVAIILREAEPRQQNALYVLFDAIFGDTDSDSFSFGTEGYADDAGGAVRGSAAANGDTNGTTITFGPDGRPTENGGETFTKRLDDAPFPEMRNSVGARLQQALPQPSKQD